MKYLWLIFLACLLGLILQVKLSDPVDNPFADGSLACPPLPPEMARSQPALLPAPVMEHIPPLASPVHIQATSIEIFDPQTATGLMVETRRADDVDWGLPRTLPADSATALAYAVAPRLVEPVPVNTPAPTPPPLPEMNLKDVDRTFAWEPNLEKWHNDTRMLAMLSRLSGVTEVDGGQRAGSAVRAIVQDVQLYPVPQDEPIETASLDPGRLMSGPLPSVPNLYLPEGALDEEGAMLTLIRPELKAYELPDAGSAAAAVTLKEGEQVRPLTRLRNADSYDWIKFNKDGKTWWAQAEYFIRVDPRNRRQFPEGNLAVGQEQVDRNSALPVDYKPDDLAAVAAKYTFGAKEVLIRKEAVEAFERMAEAAEKEGLKLLVFSGFRDFAYQKNLYLDAVSKYGPKQNGTAAPGYSEHQLGTTVDICGENRRTILSGTFGETPEGRWLHENSERFGFRKSYTQENTEIVGYKPEPWHFRYIGIAQKSGSTTIADRK